MNADIQIISLEGNIGSGKTTLLTNLKKQYENNPNVIFLKEPVDEWSEIKDENGITMLEKFYGDQPKYSFSFQMMAYISRLKILRDVIKNINTIKLKENKKKENQTFILITERSLYTDKMVFAKMLFDSGKIEYINYQIYLNWFNTFADDFPVNKIIYVKADPEICYARISKRNRAGENNIPIEYLTSCDNYHNNMLDKSLADCVCEKQLILDGNINIYDNADVLADWINRIDDFIQNKIKINGLVDWIDADKIDISRLSLNESSKAIKWLKENPDKIDWSLLSFNTNLEAIKLLRKNPDKINWMNLSQNASDDAISLLKENPDKICWYYLSRNPSAIDLLKENPLKIDWTNLSGNPSPIAIQMLIENQHNLDWGLLLDKTNSYSRKVSWIKLAQNPTAEAISLLKKHPEKIDWEYLSLNPNAEAIALLKENPLKIDWEVLALNTSIDAIQMLRENPDKIDWYNLSSNPNAIALLKENPDKIDWRNFSKNCYIFKDEE